MLDGSNESLDAIINLALGFGVWRPGNQAKNHGAPLSGFLRQHYLDQVHRVARISGPLSVIHGMIWLPEQI